MIAMLTLYYRLLLIHHYIIVLAFCTKNNCYPAYFFFFELESLLAIFGSYWVANTFNVVADVVNAGFLRYRIG